MTTVFIGGSRSISRLSKPVQRRLDGLVEKAIPVLIGDASGADKAVQAYLRDVAYDNVSVYCSGEVCRNNLRNWPIVQVDSTGANGRKDRKFFALKDGAMSRKATHGFMLWDGKSVGTLVNVIRLLQYGRASVIYLAPTNAFVEVRSDADYKTLITHCASDLCLQGRARSRARIRWQFPSSRAC